MVTDARGASSAFSYNNRHKVTGITYGVPSGVAATPNVTFGYDEAGNRTSMTDGFGTATYHYDVLSRMDWETRSLTGVGSFTISYAYNLAGQLASVTDPANDSVTYAYNSGGEIAAINGSAYGGVTQYSSGLQFRAWGGLKAISYGNGLSLSNTYNSRLQLQQMEVKGTVSSGSPSLIKTQYQYYPDGTPKYTQDTMDSRFDRAWTYDYVGRLSVAYTGQEADNYAGVSVPVPQTGPYLHAHQYDVWNNLTSRTGRYWSQTTDFTSTYNSQNQQQGWTYDASGNLLNDTTNQYDYDAAGRNVSAAGVTQSFDGLGRTIKRVADLNPVTYYLYSTPMGGKLLTELFGGAPGQQTPPMGSKIRGYVYAGEVVVARQEKVGGVSRVEWEHQDRLTGSLATSRNALGGAVIFGRKLEPDPMGADVGLADPLINPPLLEPGDIAFDLVDPDLMPDGRCWSDGAIIGCASMDRMISTGAVLVGVSAIHWPWATKNFGFYRAIAQSTSLIHEETTSSSSRTQIATEDIRDENGNIVYYKGDTISTYNVKGGDHWEYRGTEYVNLAAGEPIDGGGLFQSKSPVPRSTPTPKPVTCTVILAARPLDSRVLNGYYHSYVTVQQTGDNNPLVYHAFPEEVGERTLLVGKANIFNDKDRDWKLSQGVGNLHSSQPLELDGPCDKIRGSFDATMRKLNEKKIDYEYPITNNTANNSNAFAYTLLQRWRPGMARELERTFFNLKFRRNSVPGYYTLLPID